MRRPIGREPADQVLQVLHRGNHGGQCHAIIAGAIGLLLGYAAGLTALLREAVRGVKSVERDVATGVEQVEERVTGV